MSGNQTVSEQKRCWQTKVEMRTIVYASGTSKTKRHRAQSQFVVGSLERPPQPYQNRIAVSRSCPATKKYISERFQSYTRTQKKGGKLTTARIEGLRNIPNCENGFKRTGLQRGCTPPSRSNVSRPRAPGWLVSGKKNKIHRKAANAKTAKERWRILHENW